MKKTIEIKFNIGDNCYRFDEENNIVLCEKVTEISVMERKVSYKTENFARDSDALLFARKDDCVAHAKRILMDKFRYEMRIILS